MEFFSFSKEARTSLPPVSISSSDTRPVLWRIPNFWTIPFFPPWRIFERHSLFWFLRRLSSQTVQAFAVPELFLTSSPIFFPISLSRRPSLLDYCVYARDLIFFGIRRVFCHLGFFRLLGFFWFFWRLLSTDPPLLFILIPHSRRKSCSAEEEFPVVMRLETSFSILILSYFPSCI